MISDEPDWPLLRLVFKMRLAIFHVFLFENCYKLKKNFAVVSISKTSVSVLSASDRSATIPTFTKSPIFILRLDIISFGAYMGFKVLFLYSYKQIAFLANHSVKTSLSQ